jgi:hypothetical protein
MHSQHVPINKIERLFKKELQPFQTIELVKKEIQLLSDEIIQIENFDKGNEINQFAKQLIENMKALQIEFEKAKKAVDPKNIEQKVFRYNLQLFQQIKNSIIQAAKVLKKLCHQLNSIYPYLVPADLFLILLKNGYDSYSVLSNYSKKSPTLQLIYNLAKLIHSLIKILSYTNILDFPSPFLTFGSAGIKSLLFYQKISSYHVAEKNRINLIKVIQTYEKLAEEKNSNTIDIFYPSMLRSAIHLERLRQEVDTLEYSREENKKKLILFIINLLATGGLIIGNYKYISLTFISMTILLMEKMCKAKNAYDQHSKEQEKLEFINEVRENDLTTDAELSNDKSKQPLKSKNIYGRFFLCATIQAKIQGLTTSILEWHPDHTPLWYFPRKSN